MRILSLLTPFLAGTLCFAQNTAKPEKPYNVLFIISDDLNCQIGAYGNPDVKTPNLDRLAKWGMRFDRACCNYPVCSPSRTSFLSGRYPKHTEVVGNGTDPRVVLGQSFQFLPEYFHAHGYFTAGIGKVAHTPEHQNSIRWDVGLDPQTYEADGTYVCDIQEMKKHPAQEHPDGITAQTVARLMEEHKDNPFFISAGFHKPHAPRTAPQMYFDMYPLDKIRIPAGETEKGIPPIALPPGYQPDMSEKKKREYLQSYYASVSFMDAQVGVLLDALDRLGLKKNTIVVFLGDNGYHLGDHGGFWGKMSLMDGSVRVPLIIYAPGMSADAQCKRAVELVDLFPTLTDLCGIPTPEGLDGMSLRPLLKDPTAPDWNKSARSVVVRGKKQAGCWELGRSVHDDRYTLIQWPDDSLQLYDDVSDPGQTRNLADDPAYAKNIAQLKPLLLSGKVVAHRGIKVQKGDGHESQ